MKFVKDIKSLKKFVGYVVLCAPQNFPREDFLAETEHVAEAMGFGWRWPTTILWVSVCPIRGIRNSENSVFALSDVLN
jgi:hypothetical protein